MYCAPTLSHRSLLVRTGSGAPSTIQQLTLHSGGHVEPWTHYIRAVKHIRTLVHLILGGTESDISGSEYELRAQRHVFTKVQYEMIVKGY